MTTRPQGVLIITADGEVMAFRDAGMAASYVEAVDVRDGEYEAFLTLGGDVLQPSVRPDDEIWVELIATGTNDMERLKRRLAELQQRNGFVSDPDDPSAVANELLAIEWSLRWPKRPRWLDRRLHGEGRDRSERTDMPLSVADWRRIDAPHLTSSSTRIEP